MKKKILLYALLPVGLFLLLSYGFVPEVLSGKIVNQSDISGWQGMSREMMEWNSAHPDDQTAWTESMFSGMPTTTIHSSTKGDWTQKLYDLLLVGRRPATYLFISLLGAYLMMLVFGISPILAMGGAFAVTFCAYNLQIIQVGHNTKMQAIAFLPWALAAFVWTYRKVLNNKKFLGYGLLGSALFGLAISFQVKANHPQITYYLAIMLVLYALALLIWLLISKDRRSMVGRFFAASGLLLVLGCAGIATNAIKLLPTMEYTPYSMRGGSTAKTGGDGSKGLKLDYATAWSYGWEELPNLMIPNFNGGSSSGAIDPDHSETYELLREAGQGNAREVCKNLPLYWGPQPFTAGPMYIGAVTIFLFLLGLILCRGRDKWWIVTVSLLAVLLAVGNHFLAFTKFFYDFVPLYNKFRTVSMALVVLQFTLPILAFKILDKIVRENAFAEAFRRKGWIALAVCGGFCLLVCLFPGIAGSFSSEADSGMADILVSALAADRAYLLRMDALRSLIFIALAYLVILWGCRKGRKEAALSRRALASVLVCLLLVADLFPVAKRYLNHDDFVTPTAFKSQFNKRPVDEMILEDKDPSYRVLDLTVNVFNDSHPSYWHKNIGGYSPAKLQRYQEFIESTLSSEIQTLSQTIGGCTTIQEAEEALPYLPGLAALNCRYIIIDGSLPPLRYSHAKGNAWFTGEQVEGYVRLDSYAPNELRYSYSADRPARLVFSEVYYPVGWTLSLDGGEETLPIELEGSLLRAAQVPAGEHSLVMRFDPPSYRNGELISRCSSISLILIVLLCLAGAALKSFKKQ